MNQAFQEMTSDIIAHPVFQNLKYSRHHGEQNSLFDHSVDTAFCAFRLAHYFGLPEERVRAVTRAALLHDFFLYDWRAPAHRRYMRQYRGFQRLLRMHAFTHGILAARRAGRRFDLDDRQRSAIISHMFPLAPFPRNSEAWILTLADKVVASREMSEAAALKILRWCHIPRRSAAA